MDVQTRTVRGVLPSLPLRACARTVRESVVEVLLSAILPSQRTGRSGLSEGRSCWLRSSSSRSCPSKRRVDVNCQEGTRAGPEALVRSLVDPEGIRGRRERSALWALLKSECKLGGSCDAGTVARMGTGTEKVSKQVVKEKPRTPAASSSGTSSLVCSPHLVRPPWRGALPAPGQGAGRARAECLVSPLVHAGDLAGGASRHPGCEVAHGGRPSRDGVKHLGCRAALARVASPRARPRADVQHEHVAEARRKCCCWRLWWL